jgi:RNA polymerase sigma-70 factor (ECF subfamily)
VKSSAGLSEADLMVRVRAGSKEAYKEIVTRYMKQAYYIALGFVRNPQDALDISQEAFIKAYRQRKSFDPDRPFFPWFYRLLKNLCLDHVKKVKRRGEVPFEEVKILEKEQEDFEMKRAVWGCLDSLPPEQREIIILRYFRQLSYKEIAEFTGKPVGTVMSSLYYAKRKMKSAISRYLGKNE